MSTVDLALDADGWRARLQAVPDTATNRRDGLVGLVIYFLGAVLAGYLAGTLGMLLGAALESVGLPAGTHLLTGLLLGGAMIGMIAMSAVAELLRRTLVYTLDARPAGLHVQVERTGIGAMIPLSLARAGAVTLPEPWPASFEGDPTAFKVPWTTLRELSLQPHALVFTLSAERHFSLSIRGHVYEELEPLERLVEACVRTGDPSEVPEALRALLERSDP